MPQHKELSRDDIWQMLSSIDAYDRDDWITIGMALKSYLGDAGFSLFDDWSQTADNYQASAARSVWRSFRGSGVNIGTLVHMAKQNGWKPDQVATMATRVRPRTRAEKSVIAEFTTLNDYALNIWNRTSNGVGSHPYALEKGIDWEAGAQRGIASGKIIGQNVDCVVVPIRNIAEWRIQAVQCISVDGKKQTFGSMTGAAFICGNTLDKSIPWYVVEGWADAISLVFHHSAGNAVAAAAMGKDRLNRVARDLAAAYSPTHIKVVLDAA